MSKPAGKCVFCNKGGLSKGHILPDWIATFLRPRATHREQIIGEFATFVPTAKGPAAWRKVKQGHTGTRKPRNTCKTCNSGWMSLIEQGAIPAMEALMLGRPFLLDTFNQRLLASFLCLVSMRIDLAARGMPSVTAADRDWLRAHFLPSQDWRIWIAHHLPESVPIQHYHFSGLVMASDPTAKASPEYCNSQVTTLVLGNLCAHLFSSSVWHGLLGYEGIQLSQIWPPRAFDIDTSALPQIAEADVVWLHEALARESQPP